MRKILAIAAIAGIGLTSGVAFADQKPSNPSCGQNGDPGTKIYNTEAPESAPVGMFFDLNGGYAGVYEKESGGAYVEASGSATAQAGSVDGSAGSYDPSGQAKFCSMNYTP